MALKETIIHESQKLFSLNGFLSTGINEIIKASGTSKGGFYNHFSSKEELFFDVLEEAQKIWREKTLFGLDEIQSPTGKLIKLLENYRDRYLTDLDNFPGGCLFVTFSVELDDQRPHLAKEVDKGFTGLKRMIREFLDNGKAMGELNTTIGTDMMSEMIFAGMIGASVIYGTNKSADSLNKVINSLIHMVKHLKPD